MMTPKQAAVNRTARLVRETSKPVYTTDTATAAMRTREALLNAADDLAGEDWCHVCSRATDHRGEHDDDQLLRFANSPLGRRLIR